MKPARTSQRHFENTRLLVVQNGGTHIQHSQVKNLSDFFNKGDLLVINKSGTLPSSFRGRILRSGAAIELRLASFQGANTNDFSHWRAVSFGEGDWHKPTENRGPAPELKLHDQIRISENLTAHVQSIHEKYNRLFSIEFKSSRLMEELYRSGKPIQYSYLEEDLKVWDQQTLLAGAPISVEPPSAAFALNWATLFKLQEKGVQVATLLHSAGLSSTGDDNFDQAFPLDEYFEIPNETIAAIQQTKAQRGRVIAVGTTVTRALESAYLHSEIIQQKGRTTLRLSANTQLKVVDVLLTGMHEPDTSHANLMEAFAKPGVALIPKIEEVSKDYRSHEYGDLTLLAR